MTTAEILISVAAQLKDTNANLQNIAAALQNRPFTDSQVFAVLVGGILGLIPYLSQVYFDRARIRLSIQHIFIPHTGTNAVTHGIQITISNSGRRPIKVEKVFLKFKDGEAMLFLSDSLFINGSSGLPMTLNEANSHSVFIAAGSIARSIRQKGVYPIIAGFSDALGKEYKTKNISSEFWDLLFKGGTK